MGYADTALVIWGKYKESKSASLRNPAKEAKECEIIPFVVVATDFDPVPDDPETAAVLGALPADHPALTGHWPPRAPELETWSHSWRERWAIQAEALEAPGTSIMEAERVAFLTVLADRVRAGLPATGTEAEWAEDEPEINVGNTNIIPPRPAPAKAYPMLWSPTP